MPHPGFFGNSQCLTRIYLVIPNASSVIVLIPNTSLDVTLIPAVFLISIRTNDREVDAQGEILRMTEDGFISLKYLR